MRTTHSLAIMEVPVEVYKVISEKLREAGYFHAVSLDGTLDMTGIGIAQEPAAE